MIQEDRLLRYSRLCLLLFVLLIAVLTRLVFLEHRGFLEADEGAYYRFFSTELVYHSISGGAAGMWARQIYFWLLYFWSNFFKVTPSLLLYHNAILGIMTVVLVYFIGKKIFGQTAGIFAAAFLAVSFNHIYHVRHMKDFSTTIFLFTVSLLALIMFLETEKKNWIIIAGISLGMMSGSNPASYPIAGILFIFVFVLSLLKFFRRVPSKRTPILTRFFLFSISYILPLACIELFYPLAKHLLPFWNIDTQHTYFNSLIGHLLGNRPDAYGTQKEGLIVYLKGFSTDGIFFILMAFVGTIIILMKFAKERRSVYILIAASSWGCVLIYGFYPNISDYFRNVLTSLVGMAILSGLVISRLTELVYKYIKKSGLKIILETALLIMIISYGYSYSSICLKDVSAAQQMHDYIQVDRASMTEPSRSVYYWEHYYFRDRTLSVNTWEEVFRNYLSRRAEYLVLLVPPWTKATEILESKYKPTKFFKHLTSDRKQIEFGLFDLNQERVIFTERFNFHLIDKIDCPEVLTLPCYDGRMLEYNLGLITTRFEIKTIKDANLLLLNGRVSMHRPGDLLTVMIGDEENPSRYYLEMFPAKKALTSINTTWQIEDPIPPEIIISLCYTNNMDGFSGRAIEISGFELSLYYLPEERKRLVVEVPVLKPDEKKIETFSKILARYGKNFTPQSPVVANGGFSFPPDYKGSLPPSWHIYGKGTNVMVIPHQENKKNILELTYDSPDTWHKIYQEIPASRFRPNTRYRIRFRAKTNLKNEGEIYLFVQSWNPRWRKFLLHKFFWKPWWCWYEFDFTTLPDSVLPLNLYLGDGKLDKPDGKLSFADITINKVKY